MIKDTIKNFPKQFEYEPEIINANKLGAYESYVIGGMGGSGLVTGIIRAIKPTLDVAAHHEYGLPRFLGVEKLPADKANSYKAEKRLFIAISHSGDTEEILDFYKSVVEAGLPTAVIAAKGMLLDFAKENGAPYIDLPGDDDQPRMSLGYTLRALLKLIGEEGLYKETGELVKSLKPEKLEVTGKDLAETISGKVPIIYSSRRNQALAYNWKIKLNETGKIPAFYNTFPELNHNEMQGFDVNDRNVGLSEKMHFVFLEDDQDHPRVKDRMRATAKLYRDRGLVVEHIGVDGESRMEKIFSSLALADWTAYYVSQGYGAQPEQVPMIEEFKKLL